MWISSQKGCVFVIEVRINVITHVVTVDLTEKDDTDVSVPFTEEAQSCTVCKKEPEESLIMWQMTKKKSFDVQNSAMMK